MTSQFENYLPVQGLATLEEGINSLETITETSSVSSEGDAQSTETISDSVVVNVT